MPRTARRSLAAAVPAAALLAVGALGLAGCGAAATTASGPPTVTNLNPGSGGFAGAEISPAFSPPAGTFTATTGAAYDLAGELAGRVTLVYFGYTHCPDVCPTTMADLGAAIRTLPAATAARVHVDFVTSDPQHDSTAVMRTWLAHFDSGLANPFLGLTTGTDGLRTVQAYAAKVGVQLEDPKTDAAGEVTDMHAAQVLAFSPDGLSHLVWTPGTTVGQYAADITRLAAGRT